MDENAIRPEIVALEERLARLYKDLFKIRFDKLIEGATDNATISDLKFTSDGDNWQISYQHVTDKFDMNDYNYNTDSDDDSVAQSHRRTCVMFGKNVRYYIRTVPSTGIKFKIYRNQDGILRVVNADYDVELDMDEQEELISVYCKSDSIPETAAVLVFKYMNDNEWGDEHIINYMTRL